MTSDRPLNISRNSLYLPVRRNMDLRYTREIPIAGTVRGEIIAELKNVFNTQQMAGINTVVTTDAAGNPLDADSDRPVRLLRRDGIRAAEISARVQGQVLRDP